jgi:hypothetical protein
MYSQVYFHSVRRIYDVHLIDFLQAWLPGGKFPTSLKELLKFTNIEVMKAIKDASDDETKPGHKAARRIVRREHFKRIYSRNPDDIQVYPEAGRVIYEALCKKYGPDNFRYVPYAERSVPFDFPVQDSDRQIVSASLLSDVLAKIPLVTVNDVFVDPSLENESKMWLRDNRAMILQKAATPENE